MSQSPNPRRKIEIAEDKFFWLLEIAQGYVGEYGFSWPEDYARLQWQVLTSIYEDYKKQTGDSIDEMESYLYGNNPGG